MASEWIVVSTHYAQENQASLNLQHAGFETYLPLARVEKRQQNGLLVARLRPLFTSYVFVGLDFATQRWQQIAYMRGVKQILGWRDGRARPDAVKPTDMQRLKDKLASFGGPVPIGLSRPKYMNPHTMVQVLFGPFRDHPAVVKQDMGARVEILLWFAGAERTSKLPRECLAVPV